MNDNERIERMCELLKEEGYEATSGFILAVHKRELEKKDDERLTIVANYENVIAYKDRQVLSLSELVKELANALCSATYRHAEKSCEDVGMAIEDCLNRKYRALVAKAREVAK